MSKELSLDVVTTLRPEQRRAVETLANGGSFEDAAAAAGVTERTIQRWKNDPVFVDALRVMDTDHIGALARGLNAASKTALEVLVKVMTDEKAGKGVRVRAASEVLKHRAIFADLMNFADRLAEIEDRLGVG